MKSLFQTYFFWIFFVIVAGVSGTVAFYYFPQANPIIHLDITMNRTQAIAQATTLANQLQLGPLDASHAASFSTDDKTKTFVELEAGGKKAFVAMMKNNLYQPYQWIVRRFKPFDRHELLVQFTPEGNPYGFQEIISEETQRTNLEDSEAQKKAESFATAVPWNINFDNYSLVETSQETRTSGRIDHIFMYERIDTKIGDGFYRLKIIVSGDRVSELEHLVKIPDAFGQRYDQMRSANENIASIATILMLLLYVVGCCFIGLFFLMRDRWLIWRTPFYWGIFVAVLVACNIPNQLPLQWMNYDTALSPIGFLSQQGISIIYTLLFLLVAFTMIFMAAESLSRRAFGHHLQFWHLFNPQFASTYSVAGFTLSGYLLVPIMLCYTVLFYVIALRYFGWWTPSSALFNPNILATYFPWLESISLSLQAGFLEECLFRAIPLATAALVGSYFGKRNWWIAGAFILQALIFGAAHANYPAQPAYFRVVELFADSTLFGGIYLWFGLLPAIITHVVYDVFWFALPIFISTAPGALANKIIIIAIALIPLLIILIARFRIGSWQAAQPPMYNSGWQPEPLPSDSKPHETVSPPKIITRSNTTIAVTAVLGSIGALIWFFYTPFQSDAPPFTTNRSEAYQKTEQIIQNKKIDVKNWYPLLNAKVQQHAMQKQHRFIWQEGGKKLYHDLIGTYLPGTYWATRLVKFDGPIEERAEEHQIFLQPDGSFLRYFHKLPESRPGATLVKQDAQTMAQDAIATQFALSPADLQHVSSVSYKQPERLDWIITYSSSKEYPLSKGQARVAVTIAGNEVTDAYRYIHVPEQWERQEENRLLFTNIIYRVCYLLAILLTIIGSFLALLQGQIRSLAMIFGFFLAISVITLFDLANSWPYIIAKFTTSQPFLDQLLRSFPIKAIMLVLRAGALAVMFGFVTQATTAYYTTRFWPTMVSGISLGTLLMGLYAGAVYYAPSLEPTWANFIPMRSMLPVMAGIGELIIAYLNITILLLLCLLCMNQLTDYGTRRLGPNLLFCLLAGYMSAGFLFGENFLLFALSGIFFAFFFGASYYTIVRFDRATIPIITGTFVIMQTVQQFFFNGYPGIIMVTLVSIGIISISAFCWSKLLHSQRLITPKGELHGI